MRLILFMFGIWFALVGAAFMGDRLSQSVSASDGVATLSTVKPVVLRYRAVLAAGDASIGNFDNATTALARRLERSDAETRLLTSDFAKVTEKLPLATVAGIDALMGEMRLKSDEGCFVFITSHGSTAGLSMMADADEELVLRPERLAEILARRCGAAPTVAILSGCHTGTFLTPEMKADNRIILTAARKDRTSFGCSADTTFTYFDECLLEAMDEPGTWGAIFARTKACVTTKEEALDVDEASMPQAFFGAAVKDLGIE